MIDIVISAKDEKPIYEQVREQLASQIINGELAANFCLPSIRVVARELNISVITVKKAWELLESEGFIYTRAGKGCFVAEHKQQHLEDKKIALAAEKLQRDLPYYKGLGLSLDELIALVSKEF